MKKSFLLLVLIVFPYFVFSQSSGDNPPITLRIVPKEPLINPERGFHTESIYFVHNLKNPFAPYTYPEGWIDDLNEKYHSSSDGIRSMQLYLYLTEYMGKPIPEEAFETMQMLFDDLKSRGFKVVLRFAYDNTYEATDAKFQDVFRHLNQLEPFIKKNLGLIDVWQIGFIGAWGEGHSSPMSNDPVNKAKMIKRILDILGDKQTTIRLPEQKNELMLEEKYLERIGYNNDYFTASEHPKAAGNDFMVGTEDYEQVQKESPYLKVIGEIPYAEATEWGLHTLISIPNSLTALRDHHYSLFDITQNNELNLENWRKTTVTSAMMDSLKILYDPSYFQISGVPVGRSAYQFVRDHLGYRLYFENVKLERNKRTINYNIQLKNVGFSTVHNPRPVYLVFLRPEYGIMQMERLDVNPADWQPYDVGGEKGKALIHTISGKVKLDYGGKLKVGLWLPDADEELQHLEPYSIQFANEGLEVWKGAGAKYRINIIGEI